MGHLQLIELYWYYSPFLYAPKQKLITDFSALILFQYRKGGTPTLLKVCIEKSTFFTIALFLSNFMLGSGASTGEINIIV